MEMINYGTSELSTHSDLQAGIQCAFLVNNPTFSDFCGGLISHPKCPHRVSLFTEH